MSNLYNTQNTLLLNKLLEFYRDTDKLDQMLGIINGDSKYLYELLIGLLLIMQKKYYTTYELKTQNNRRFRVYIDYKLKLSVF